MAFDNPEATHGYGNHKGKGGSGRHGQNRILAALTMQEGLSQKDLAYLLGIRPQSLSQALAKLEEDGMITRKHNEEDARVINVYLTEAGRIRAAKVAEDRKKSAADIFSVLTDEEKDQLAGILAKLSESIDAQFGERKPHEED
jgi:DNA-binding MarR family transcriptional regulator